MNCPHCKANLEQQTRGGDTMLRNKGLVLKAHGLVLICPKCKGDVLLSPTLHKRLQERVILFFKRA